MNDVTFERGTEARAARDVLARKIEKDAKEPYAVATEQIKKHPETIETIKEKYPEEFEKEWKEQKRMANPNGDGLERDIMAMTVVLTVGSFALSSLATQDAQLSGQGGFDPKKMKNMIALGWGLTGGSAILVGLLLKRDWIAFFGVAILLFGFAWVYILPHPLLDRRVSPW